MCVHYQIDGKPTKILDVSDSFYDGVSSGGMQDIASLKARVATRFISLLQLAFGIISGR
jgi:hypothetical protein